MHKKDERFLIRNEILNEIENVHILSTTLIISYNAHPNPLPQTMLILLLMCLTE